MEQKTPREAARRAKAARDARPDGKEAGAPDADAVETITIDGRQGKVTTEGQNAFDRVSFWQFPRLEAGENALTFSDPSAKVKITYTPMWL